MNVNKFRGKTEEEAIAAAREAYGEDAVIMYTKEVKPKGLLAVFKKSSYEVTAAMKEKENSTSTLRAFNTMGTHDSINLAADEKIDFTEELSAMPKPPVQKKFSFQPEAEPKSVQEKEEFDERLDLLSERLQEKLEAGAEERKAKSPSSEELNFVRILYNTLISNEVNEIYVNQVLQEVERFIRPGNSVDIILSNVYQKLILKLGQPKTIEIGKKKPKVVFFIGPTGVGKTTTIAKIASKYKVDYNKSVAFITADTYRIAASEQLQVYANILEAPMEIVYSAQEMNEKLEGFGAPDVVFVDTAGFSHKNVQQREDMKELLRGLDKKYAKEVYLVLSATTKYRDLLDIVDTYREITDFKLIFTKLDETTTYGNILNIKLYARADLSYATTGQNVPDDIEIFDTQKIVKQLLGGNK
ncbi:MAG: flagellar biosynthesis protein FlhF [Blautia sp.]|nr:flagellar biosynthesis protein FlhF [Blautia sp.]